MIGQNDVFKAGADGVHKTPNIIWFIVDQMRGQALGSNGDPNVFTPNLDNMGLQGRLFPMLCPVIHCAVLFAGAC